MLFSPIRYLLISRSQNPSCLQLPHPPLPQTMWFLLGIAFVVSETENSAYTKCWRESKQGVLLEICENWCIRRTAVADKEKFDDEFCSEFKYDSF